MINEDVRHIIEPELAEGEELLWADKPAKRPYPWRGVYRAVFWCIWMMFVSFLTLGVLFAPANIFRGGGEESLLLRLVFICLGFAMFAYGFCLRKTYLKALLGPKYEVYGLTNKRAIILSPLWKGQQFFNWRGQDHSKNFIDGNELDTIKVEVSAGSSMGTIIFSGWWDRIRYSWYVRPNPESPKMLSNLNGFRNINNPILVAELFKNTFGTDVMSFDTPSHSQAQNEEPQVQKVRAIRTRRVMLFSIFPMMWMLYTLLVLLVGASVWLFLSFFTLPFFIASAFHAIREFIRPHHSYRISS